MPGHLSPHDGGFELDDFSDIQQNSPKVNVSSSLPTLIEPRNSLMSKVHLVITCGVLVFVLYTFTELLTTGRRTSELGDRIIELSQILDEHKTNIKAVSDRLKEVIKGESQLQDRQTDTNSRLDEIGGELMDAYQAIHQLTDRVRTIESEHDSQEPNKTAETSPTSSSLADRGPGDATKPTASRFSPGVTTANIGGPSTQSRAVRPTHQHRFDLSIPLVTGAKLHMNPTNEPDYWTVTRFMSSGPPIVVRVIPFATSIAGVDVHAIDDGQDYILTNFGEWLVK